MFACQRCTQEFETPCDGDMWVDVIGDIVISLCGHCVEDIAKTPVR